MRRLSKAEIKAKVDALKQNPTKPQPLKQADQAGKLAPKKSSKRIRKQGV
ncbi:MAG: hypothetical protein KF812_03455 [Fimbriimonadaceae bacterium]|nr:hypothetical protein [Fimbriimonadaceae bacterium]